MIITCLLTVLCLNSFGQSCTITVMKPLERTTFVEFSIRWKDSTILSTNGRVVIDSTTRVRIGSNKLRFDFTNGMDKKLYREPEKLRNPFNLTNLVCGLHVAKRKEIR